MLGLFSQGIIDAIPTYKNDKRYGALIVAFPPFNILTFLCLPFLLCTKDLGKLHKFNKVVCRIAYFPVLILTAFYFTVCNFFLIPLAYFKSVFHKYRLWKKHGWLPLYRNKFWCFLFFGIPLLLVTLVTDLYWFVKHSYKLDIAKTRDVDELGRISIQSFNKFYNMVTMLDGDKCNAKQLVLHVNEVFKVNGCIFGALYNNKKTLIEKQSSQLRRALTRMQSMGMEEGLEYNLRGLKTYNLIKRVIWSSATHRPTGVADETSEVNLPLLKGLLNEIHMELYVEDFLHRAGFRRNYRSYKEIDITEEKGYDKYIEFDDHVAIKKVLS